MYHIVYPSVFDPLTSSLFTILSLFFIFYTPVVVLDSYQFEKRSAPPGGVPFSGAKAEMRHTTCGAGLAKSSRWKRDMIKLLCPICWRQPYCKRSASVSCVETGVGEQQI
ncbi:hypothetical protein XENORESO_000335 [Xenotaenia resolanae]|uniref:Uncharacterized protein n=1 Tax=Xenotaenia resolanae TaxID=208358 RepID=A0ABV0X095_9TELE